MLYRFNIELSNIDQGLYETLDFRVSQHPSEIASYLLTRVLAFALSYQQGLAFSPSGLSDPEAPAIQLLSSHNTFDLWIEIGNPSSRKLHKAKKTARQVVIYTYKNAEVLVNDIKANKVHKRNELKIFSFDEKFISALENLLEKNNSWSLLVQQNQISLSTKGESIVGELKTHPMDK
jgi:uncharacterized protein YaeQ